MFTLWISWNVTGSNVREKFENKHNVRGMEERGMEDRMESLMDRQGAMKRDMKYILLYV